MSASTNPETRTILVVDDEETVTTFFEMLLMHQGFEVQTAHNGRTALDMLKKDSYTHYDLVILDLMMPKSGYEVLREIESELYQKVPVFIVTARALDPGTVDMIQLESSVVEFWRKPIDPKQFIARVHEILGTQPRRR